MYGVEGALSYSHKNVFKGAEKLQLTFTGAIEAQKLIVNQEADSSFFNTKEFGPKLSLTIPRSLFIDKWMADKTNHYTELTSFYNYQERPDFTRSIAEGAMTWVFHHRDAITWLGSPATLSLIKITKTQSFQDKIDALNDRLLAASYADHIIAGGKLTFKYNDQSRSKNKNVFFTQASIEAAGNTLRGLQELSGQQKDPATDSYSLNGIRFAQFVKFLGRRCIS